MLPAAIPVATVSETLREVLLRHPLGAVPQQRVRNLVAHDHCECVGILRDRNQPRVDRHLTAGQAERIHLGRLQDTDRPLERTRVDVRLGALLCGEIRLDLRRDGDQALHDSLDFAHLRPARDDLRLRQHFVVRLQAERGLFLGAGRD